MKKLLYLFVLLLFNFTLKAQQPITQNLGSDSTLIRLGATYNGILKGGIVLQSYSDTTAANATHIDFYTGALIWSNGDTSIYARFKGSTSQYWVKVTAANLGPGGGAWQVGGNFFSVLPTPQPNIGTLAPWGGAMGFMTNSVTRAIIPDAGFVLSGDTTNNKIFTLNPTTKEWGLANWNNGGSGTSYTAGDGLLLTGTEFKVLTKRSITIDNDSLMLVNDSTASPVSYFYGTNVAGRKGWYAQSGITGVTPTLQQVLTAGSTLTGNNTIDADGSDFAFSDVQFFTITASDIITLSGELSHSGISSAFTSSANGRSSVIINRADSISIAPSLGVLNIDSLRSWTAIADSAYKRIMTWDERNGRWEYFDGYFPTAGDDVNIYNSDGTLTGGRTVTAAGNDFTISGAGDVTIDVTSGKAILLYSGNNSVNIQDSHTTINYNGGGVFNEIMVSNSATDGVQINPHLGNLEIDTLNYTLSTTGKKIMLRDTATGLVQNIDPALLGGGGITVGTTTITSGTDTRVLFQDGTTLGQDAGFTYNKTTDVARFGLGVEFVNGDNWVKNTTLFGAQGMWTSISAGNSWGVHDNGPSGAILQLATGSYPSFANATFYINARTNQRQGADVASAAGAIAVGRDGNTFEITGTAAITLISNLNWTNGAVIYLVFTSTATLTDGTANSGTSIGMELAGNADFTASADDVITLVLSELSGTQRWREVARSVN